MTEPRKTAAVKTTLKTDGAAGKSTRTLIFLFILFLAPILLAWAAYETHAILNHRSTTINNGILINPPFSITKLHLLNKNNQPLNNTLTPHKNPKNSKTTTNGKWMLMLVNPGGCDHSCRKSLRNLQNIRTATGKNMSRVERAIITFHETNPSMLNQIIAQHFKGTRHLIANKQQYIKMMGQYVNKPYVAKQGAFFIVDPLGNIMMSYHPGMNPNLIYKDLKKLLKISQIG